MAVKYWVGAVNNNWNNNTGNWVDASTGGVTTTFPTNADDVLMAAVVVRPITVNVNSGCKTIDFTGYGSNALTVNAQLSVLNSITLINSMGTISGTGYLAIASNGAGSTCTMISNGKSWGLGLYIDTALGSLTTTLTGIWTVGGLTTVNGGAFTINNSTLNVTGNIIVLSAGIQGTTHLIMTGSGTLSNNGSLTQYIRNPLTINASGAITIGYFAYAGGSNTFRFITASSITSNNVFSINSGQLDLSGIMFNSLYTNGSITLLSDLKTSSFWQTQSSTITGLFDMYVGGSLNLLSGNSSVVGKVICNGTGTLYGTANTNFLTTSEFIINSLGNTITIGSFFSLTTRFTYIAGNVITTGSRLTLNTGTFVIDSGSIQWNNIVVLSSTLTINSQLLVNGTLSFNNQSLTVNGTAGFTAKNLNYTVTGSSKTLNLLQANTYNIDNGTLTLQGVSAAIRAIITSSSGTLRVPLNLINGSGSNINWCTATRIDSSGGNTVISTNTVKTQTINWGEAGNFFFFF